MKSTDNTPPNRIYRKDYQAPAWDVVTVDLEFDLRGDASLAGAGDAVDGAHTVRVRCTQLLRAVSGQPGTLVLDGRDMELCGVRIDGVEIDSARWRLTPDQLIFDDFPAEATLETVGCIQPFANSSLEGLYGSSGLLCTQCESHGFSRITWFQDRPDVLSPYRVTIIADAERYPVLLSNGNRVSESVDHGVRTAVWHDPWPKPCYLFALVAGKLSCVRDSHTTPSGREVAIEFWCDRGLEAQLQHGIESLKASMRFDEQVYNREYDLDLYMVVVARAFNMGAMENKGLNIFNPKCVLAHPDTATDDDHVLVEAVVGHEYLHNWTGNRITCRDWFQLSLKEGLTVFREQQFSAANAGGSAQRIHEVTMLRERQFVEDAGPLSHPVRPDSYVDMNNFYTSTVYEKGAELIRVLHSFVGDDGFREGMARYFETHDGRAATIEDFIDSFALASTGLSREQLLRWYSRPGTPRVSLQCEPTADGVRVVLTQSAPENATPEGVVDAAENPLPIPVCLEFLDDQGALALADGGDGNDPSLWRSQLVATQAECAVGFARPTSGVVVPVFSGGLPAPVRALYRYSDAELKRIVHHANDPVARWDAQQERYRRSITPGQDGSEGPVSWSDVTALFEKNIDRAVLAEMLRLPSKAALLSEGENVDPLALDTAHAATERMLAEAVWSDPSRMLEWLEVPAVWAFNEADVAARRLAVRVLELGMLSGHPHLAKIARDWVEKADNLSLRFGALEAAWRASSEDALHLFNVFRERHARDELVIDRAFALRARYADRDTWNALLDDPAYKRTLPNRVRAVMDTLVRQNLATFYARDGDAQRAWAREMIELDAVNPQLAARLVGALEICGRLGQPWRDEVLDTLTRVRERIRSPNMHEQLSRLLHAGRSNG